MPTVQIPYDLTIALARKDTKETEEIAQVNSSVMIEGTIATCFVLSTLWLWPCCIA